MIGAALEFIDIDRSEVSTRWKWLLAVSQVHRHRWHMTS